MKEIQEYITQAEFCRRMGITKQALQGAEKRERVEIENHNGRRMIEYYKNRRSYIQTSRNPSRYVTPTLGGKVKHKQNGNRDSGKESKIGYHRMDIVEDPPDTDGDFHENMNRLEAESIKQVYLAKQAKLKFLKDAGVLIETETVKREWQEIAVRVQKTMLSIPDRVSEIFASTSDAIKIYNDLTAEIRHALSSLQYRVKIEDEDDDNFEELTENEGKDQEQKEGLQ
jgi:hypothetical protein